MLSKKLLPLWRGLGAIFLSLCILSTIGYGIADAWRGMVDIALGTASSLTTSEAPEGGELTYQSDFKNTTELVNEHMRLGELMSEEGSVLLKNTGSALPLLTEKPKVTLFGVGSQVPWQGGSMGSGNAANKDTVAGTHSRDLVAALTEKEFSVNTVMTGVYAEIAKIEIKDGFGMVPAYQNPAPGGGFGVGDTITKYTIREPNPSLYDTYNAAYKTSFSSYNDAAIVVLSRGSKEAGDFHPGADGLTDAASNAGATSSLGLSDNERAVVKLATDNFEKVIVLINSNSVMEIEEIKVNDKIDSILWVGTPGNYGFLGVADILRGDANPSGHLPDTYVVNNASTPAAMNYGVHYYSNRDEINITDAEKNEFTVAQDYTNLKAAWYLIEAEGIYTGYKYYETRYADSVNNLGNAKSAKGASNNAASWDYKKEVSYPYGYGLSYTTFSQAFNYVNVKLSNRTVTASVTVKNTGSVAGKDVAQLYVQTPYSDYDKTNGIEKSAIEFIGMEKTKMLEPGEEQTLTITVDMKYLGSYDSVKAKTFILDGGTYNFAVGNGAHDALNNILAKNGKSTENGMDYNGNQNLVKAFDIGNNGEVNTTLLAKSENGYAITNQMDDADLNYYNPGTVTYLSRSDWDKTYPKTYSNITIEGPKKAEWIKTLRNQMYDYKTDATTANEVTFGAKNNLKFTDLAGVDYDDERWNLFADQLTLEETLFNIAAGGNHCAVIESVSSPKVWQTDGPNGFNGNGAPLGTVEHSNTTDPNALYFVSRGDIEGKAADANLGYNLGTMANEPVIAATFNKELVEEFGKQVGNDSLWSGHTLLWGAGMNIHRSPFNGRNHEYYSEDAMLSNYMGTAFIIGGNQYGAIIAPKHFAFNDQETNRVGVAPYMTEQKAREGDLRAFQGAFEEGNTLGVMTSFSRIGATAMNGHTGIMMNILRGEWGFKGVATTDMVNGPAFFRPEMCIMNGITMMAQNTKSWGGGADNAAGILKNWSYFTVERAAKDLTLSAQAKENIKYQLYALANSNAQNSYTVSLTPWWETLLITLIAVSATLGALSVAMYLVVTFIGKDKKEVK